MALRLPLPEKSDFEILFNDSPERFVIANARMIQEAALVRFLCYNDDALKEEVWFPIHKIHRIKRRCK